MSNQILETHRDQLFTKWDPERESKRVSMVILFQRASVIFWIFSHMKISLLYGGLVCVLMSMRCAECSRVRFIWATVGSALFLLVCVFVWFSMLFFFSSKEWNIKLTLVTLSLTKANSVIKQTRAKWLAPSVIETTTNQTTTTTKTTKSARFFQFFSSKFCVWHTTNERPTITKQKKIQIE